MRHHTAGRPVHQKHPSCLQQHFPFRDDEKASFWQVNINFMSANRWASAEQPKIHLVQQSTPLQQPGLLCFHSSALPLLSAVLFNSNQPSLNHQPSITETMQTLIDIGLFCPQLTSRSDKFVHSTLLLHEIQKKIGDDKVLLFLTFPLWSDSLFQPDNAFCVCLLWSRKRFYFQKFSRRSAVPLSSEEPFAAEQGKFNFWSVISCVHTALLLVLPCESQNDT